MHSPVRTSANHLAIAICCTCTVPPIFTPLVTSLLLAKKFYAFTHVQVLVDGNLCKLKGVQNDASMCSAPDLHMHGGL